MATILDAFVVTLGLDSSGYIDGARKARDERNRLSKEEERAEKERDEGLRKQKAQIEGVQKAALAMFAVFTAGQSLVRFAQDQINAAAGVGRLSKNLNVSTEELSAWQGAVRSLGGTAEDANGLFQTLATSLEQLRLDGTPANAALLNRAGITKADLEDPVKGVMKLHDAVKNMQGSERVEFLSRLGITPAAANLLGMTDDKLGALIAQQKRLTATTEADSKSAQEAQAALATLGGAAAKLGRELLVAAAPALMVVARGLTALAEWAEQHQATVKFAFLGLTIAVAGLTVAAGALTLALAPEIAVGLAVAGAITAIGAAIGFAIDKFPAMVKWIKDLGVEAQKLWYRLTHHGEEMPTPPVVRPAPQSQEHPDAPVRPAPTVPFRAAPASPSPSLASGGASIAAFFRSRGWTAEQAAGIEAGIMAESGGKYKAKNPNSTAYGIGQWMKSKKGGARQATFTKVMGKDIHESTLQEQLAFMDWELKNTERAAGNHIRHASNAVDASRAYVSKFMRPAAGKETTSDYARAATHLQRQEMAATPRAPHPVVVALNQARRPLVAVNQARRPLVAVNQARLPAAPRRSEPSPGRPAKLGVLHTIAVAINHVRQAPRVAAPVVASSLRLQRQAVAANVHHRVANDNRSHTEVHIATVAVSTRATDAAGIARDIKPALTTTLAAGMPAHADRGLA